MPCGTLSLHLNNAAETTGLAKRLAAVLVAGDVILLSGNMGVGKSHFARSAILSMLNQPEDIPSPTFTLVQTYEGATAEIWHADLYRLNDPSEVEELGLLDAFESAICFVEWPDRLGDLTPQNALSLTLVSEHNDDQRLASFEWSDDRWAKRLKGVL